MHAWEGYFLRRLGFSYQEIAELLGLSRSCQGTAYRLVKKYKEQPDYYEKRGNKPRLYARPLLKLWNNQSPEFVAKVFYQYLPRWVAQRYPEGSISHSLAYEHLLLGLWSLKKLQSMKTEADFARYAFAYVQRRLFGDFCLFSGVRKKAEMEYIALEEV